MSSSEFDIGSEVHCTDGDGGRLTRVVLDPVARAITYIVVEPRLSRHKGHLVPIGRVTADADGVHLSCTKAELLTFDEADELQFLPAEIPHPGYEPNQVLVLPFFGLGVRVPTTAVGAGASVPHVISSDHVPLGEVEVKRGEHVEATDGPIGRVKGLVIDPADHHVTHFLLDEGHIWGQKRVAIPITAVTRAGDGVRLSLTKDQVRDLPDVDVHAPGDGD